jgi:hypothetical protein
VRVRVQGAVWQLGQCPRGVAAARQVTVHLPPRALHHVVRMGGLWWPTRCRARPSAPASTTRRGLPCHLTPGSRRQGLASMAPPTRPLTRTLTPVSVSIAQRSTPRWWVLLLLFPLYISYSIESYTAKVDFKIYLGKQFRLDISHHQAVSYMMKVKQSHYRPWGFQEVEAPRFLDNRHMKMVRLSALRTGRIYPPRNIPGTHFCYRLSRPQGHSAAERIM